MKKLTRQELISICEDAVVPYSKWKDRDSYSSQVLIQSIYQGLKAGIKYIYRTDQGTIWIDFISPTQKQISDISSYSLPIDSRQDYFTWYKEQHEEDSDPEMFDGYGISWYSTYLGGYMPTRSRLIACNGEDWY